ncbi:MAG: TetR/AcrR family transcriptional regulator [Flavobacteriales bacterium]|nr:TetR/AcrR family transcriptional regulator [Flavobacteriales bacterium]
MKKTDPKETELLIRALQVFLRCGIRSVTMDDIASELKISKKTLYRYVSDKNDLVQKVMNLNCADDTLVCENIKKNSENAIDELLSISKHVSLKLQSIHPSLHFDLEKYYHEAWKKMQQHHAGYVLKSIETNINRGKKEGLYRKEVHAGIIARIYISKIDIIFNSEIFPPGEYNFLDVYKEMLHYHLQGILSEKGKKYLQQKMKKL